MHLVHQDRIYLPLLVHIQQSLHHHLHDYDINFVYDSNAIAVYNNNDMIGYIRAEIAKELSVPMDKGVKYKCEVTQITGSEQQTKGVNICITRLY